MTKPPTPDQSPPVMGNDRPPTPARHNTGAAGSEEGGGRTGSEEEGGGRGVRREGGGRGVRGGREVELWGGDCFSFFIFFPFYFRS